MSRSGTDNKPVAAARQGNGGRQENGARDPKASSERRPFAPAPSPIASAFPGEATLPARSIEFPADDGAGAASLFSGAGNKTNFQLFLWMFHFLRPVYGYAALAALWVGCCVSVEVLTTAKTGDAVNRITDLSKAGNQTRLNIWQWLHTSNAEVVALRHVMLLLSVLVVLMVAFRYLREVGNSKMSMNMVYYIREAVYDKLQRVGFGFHDTISTGSLINRALTDLQNCRQFVQTAILTTWEIMLTVAFNILLIITLKPWIGLLALLPLPFWTFYILRFSKKVQPVGKAVMEAQDRNVSIITEAIAGVHVIKAFATEKQEIARYDVNCQDFKSRTLGRIRLFADFQPVIRSIATASQLTLFLVASLLLLNGKLGPGALLILGSAMSIILARLQAVSTINEQYQNAIVSARRLYEVLHARPTVDEKPDAIPLPPGNGAVTFENVSFGYDPAKPVIHNVSFSAPGGSIIALVGPTGAGKSTLVNMLARFYDPQEGRVLIDGADLRDIQLSSIRRSVAFVFQETYLFSDTVAANIAYGRPNVLDAMGKPIGGIGQIEAAARLAQAHDFIEALPKGYFTILAERGASLSGGQRQRLAIARAILSQPRILVLDDATAAIDPETEDLIRRGLRGVLFGNTTFVIAHRISTVKQADLVLVLEHGRVTQSGTHDQLMETNGHYREIAAVQLHGDDEPAAVEATPSIGVMNRRSSLSRGAPGGNV